MTKASFPRLNYAVDNAGSLAPLSHRSEGIGALTACCRTWWRSCWHLPLLKESKTSQQRHFRCRCHDKVRVIWVVCTSLRWLQASSHISFLRRKTVHFKVLCLAFLAVVTEGFHNVSRWSQLRAGFTLSKRHADDILIERQLALFSQSPNWLYRPHK